MAIFWAYARAVASGSSAATAQSLRLSATVPATSTSACTRVATRKRTASLRPLSMMRMMRTSVREPEQKIQRVVVGSIAPDTIVVRARAVELAVPGVLCRHLDVEPRQIVHLCDPAARVGGAGGAGHDTWCARRGRRIKPGISAARRREIAYGSANPAPIVIRGPQPRGRQVIRRVGRCARRETRIQRHRLVDASPGDGEQVLLAHKLVLHILGHVLEAVKRSAQRHAVARKQLEVSAVEAHFDGVAIPVVLVG